MPPVINDLLAVLGVLLRFLGFLVAGFAFGRFFFENYRTYEWQVRIALALGLFALLVGLTAYASPASSGAFALGAGAALLYILMPPKSPKTPVE